MSNKFRIKSWPLDLKFRRAIFELMSGPKKKSQSRPLGCVWKRWRIRDRRICNKHLG